MRSWAAKEKCVYGSQERRREREREGENRGRERVLVKRA